jgi:GntR family transcriptional regulator, histidine utilization repressor
MDSQSLVTRIRTLILGRIQDESWPSGYRIPSEAEIMAQFSASRMTVHRAIKELAAEGHLYRQRGRGTFVARKKPRSQLLVLTDIADEIRGRGGSYFCECRSLANAPRSPLTAFIFGDERAENIARSTVIHFENGLPLQLEDRWVDLQMAPGYLQIDFQTTTSYRYLMTAAPLQKAEHELTAILPDSSQQNLLRIQTNEPCLLLKRKTWSAGHLVSYAELLYPGSRYSFGGEFGPGDR